MAIEQLLDGQVFKVATSQGDMWDGFKFGRPGDFSCYFEDFHTYNASDWTVSETNAGATQALATSAPCVGGVLLITNTNADNDAVSMQRVGHAFTPTAGTNIYFEARFQCSEATECDWLCGLVVTDTSPLANTDGIYFRKDDGDTNIDFETNSSSSASSELAIGTFAANTYVKVGVKVTGTTSIEYYVNGVKQGEINTQIPTVPLRVTFHFQDGDTGAALGALTASWDYVFVAQSRV